MFSSVLNPLRDAMLRQPEDIALIASEGQYTFAQLGERIQALRNAIRRHQPGCVMIYGHKQLDAAAAMIACAFEAVVFTFVDTANPAPRIANIATMTGAQLALLAGEPPLPLPINPMPILRCQDCRTDEALQPVVPSHHDAVFYILSTSGSTGEPKGVKISYGNFGALADWAIPLVHRHYPGAHVNHACLSFDMGVMDIFLALAVGKTVIMLNHRDNIRPLANLHILTPPTRRVSTWFSTPGFLEIMCMATQFQQAQLPDLRFIGIGGEMLSPSLVKTLHARFPQAQILNGYGPTEATCMTHAAILTPESLPDTPPLTVGLPGVGNGMAIVDKQRCPLPALAVGEIVLFGSQISPGYLPENDPRNQLFGLWRGQRCYYTGDMGYLNADGELFIKGRDDGQFKWQGNRIETGEVETTAQRIDGVQQAALVSKKTHGKVTALVLFVHLAIDDASHREAFRRELARRLPAYMVPRSVYFTHVFPLNLHGKTDRQALMQQFANGDENCNQE
ncbi:AMP-binding protein [Musicola paradisiaca]|uniref:AMP-dependent synthetase and ligase n=1 Tax=Musicola paradisiaca (strain Ech703) TaxID=579405 RepID=C6C6K8_MUSP7|nr:AMP-binding protein [Musicola paradisiaca]ACS83927.1 AMP-dependent synthetase and ligase [Musicola paradisiaca Ech703]